MYSLTSVLVNYWWRFNWRPICSRWKPRLILYLRSPRVNCTADVSASWEIIDKVSYKVNANDSGTWSTYKKVRLTCQSLVTGAVSSEKHLTHTHATSAPKKCVNRISQWPTRRGVREPEREMIIIKRREKSDDARRLLGKKIKLPPVSRTMDYT